MAYALEKITSNRTIGAPEDLSEYGLDEPQCTVDIAAGEDSYQLLIGDETTLDGLLYLSTGDGNVYLVSSGPAAFLSVRRGTAFPYGRWCNSRPESVGKWGRIDIPPEAVPR